jgi:hypothetical protein
MWKWFSHHAKRRGVGLEINGHVLESAPIYPINLKNATEKNIRDGIVRRVDQMMDARLRLETAKTAHERAVLGRFIESTDEEIDKLVYELYGLTDEEIENVELHEKA